MCVYILPPQKLPLPYASLPASLPGSPPPFPGNYSFLFYHKVSFYFLEFYETRVTQWVIIYMLSFGSNNEFQIQSDYKFPLYKNTSVCVFM